jgi:hypothetical protein
LEIFETIGAPSLVLNIVSTGSSEELLLTFTFEWNHPEIENGSQEAIAKQKGYQATAPKGVGGTLAHIREMAAAGKL